MNNDIPDLENITSINNIPTFLETVKSTYGIEVPTELDENHPLYNLWAKEIEVTAGNPPPPIYSATGSISSEFPFNFAAGLSLKQEDFPFLENSGIDPKLEFNLRIDVLKSTSTKVDMRGVKSTVFHVPKSLENPSGVIIDRGLSSRNESENSVEERNLSDDEGFDIPPEAEVNLDDLMVN